jgi:putative transposase
MTNPNLIDVEKLLADQLATASPDLLRGLLSTFIRALMSAEADAVCGADSGQRSQGRTNRRNGYRNRDFDTRAGTITKAPLVGSRNWLATFQMAHSSATRPISVGATT